eukprot:5232898-Pyramimonas_sp.AAC.2
MALEASERDALLKHFLSSQTFPRRKAPCPHALNEILLQPQRAGRLPAPPSRGSQLRRRMSAVW